MLQRLLEASDGLGVVEAIDPVEAPIEPELRLGHAGRDLAGIRAQIVVVHVLLHLGENDAASACYVSAGNYGMGASVCERAIDLQPMLERTTSNIRQHRTRAASSRSGLTLSAPAARRASLKAQLNPQSRIRPSQSFLASRVSPACSPSAIDSLPRMGTTRSSISTPSRPGACRPTARSSMSTRERLFVLLAVVLTGCASASSPTARTSQTPN